MNDELKYPHPNPSPLKGEGLKNSDTAPYPGLRPYREDEKAKFFGRDVDADILIDKVLTNRLTLLFAASGVGKSSLLQAAVIPHLKSKTGENLTVVYHTDWVSDPVLSVRDAVLQALRAEGLLPEHSEEAEFGEKLPDLLAFCEVFVRPPLVLILDQFEEFFRYQRHQTGFRELIDQLTTIITDKSLPVHLILSMREDFALELNAFKPKLPTILFENFYRLESLSKVSARKAITKPIESTGIIYEKGLTDLILNDLSIDSFFNGLFSIHEKLPSEKIELAYLQVVCSFLWRTSKARGEKIISINRYLRSGRSLGILGKYLQVKFDSEFKGYEKYVAYKTFDFLIGMQGVKVAYTIDGLSKIIEIPPHHIDSVCKKLDRMRILRRVSFSHDDWYQLYHDMYSQMIKDWQLKWEKSPEYAYVKKSIKNPMKYKIYNLFYSPIKLLFYLLRLTKKSISILIKSFITTKPIIAKPYKKENPRTSILFPLSNLVQEYILHIKSFFIKNLILTKSLLKRVFIRSTTFMKNLIKKILLNGWAISFWFIFLIELAIYVYFSMNKEQILLPLQP